MGVTGVDVGDGVKVGVGVRVGMMIAVAESTGRGAMIS